MNNETLDSSLVDLTINQRRIQNISKVLEEKLKSQLESGAGEIKGTEATPTKHGDSFDNPGLKLQNQGTTDFQTNTPLDLN